MARPVLVLGALVGKPLGDLVGGPFLALGDLVTAPFLLFLPIALSIHVGDDVIVEVGAGVGDAVGAGVGA